MSDNKQTKFKQAKSKKTKGENFQKSAKCEKIQSTPTSNTAWIDLNSKADILKLPNKCGKLGCKYRKMICFTRK